MGKKKQRREAERRAEEALRALPQVAGIAAAVAREVGSPAMQRMIAGALNAAAEAMAARSSAQDARSVPPVAPVPPDAQAAYRPHFETSGITLSPEAAQAIEAAAGQAARAIDSAAAHASRAIDTAAAAFERWAEKQGKPKPPGE